jgi:hypothetical protein
VDKMTDINSLELHDFTKVFDSGDFNYSEVNGHADYLGWHIIFFKEAGCDKVSAISFDDILMEESIKNIANKILQRIEFPVLFGDKFSLIKKKFGEPDFSDAILMDIHRYHYIDKKKELYLCFGIDCNEKLCSLEIITNKEVINNKMAM